MVYGIHGEYEKKFLQCQQFWRQKWIELERINRNLNKTSSTKLENELDRLGKLTKDVQKPCENIELDLINCYEINRKKTLLCSDQAKKFAQCIELYRWKLLKQ